MLLDKDDKEKRLQSPRNLLNLLPRNAVAFRPLHVTKQIGTKNIPLPLKVVAGVLAKTEPVKEVAEVFDISESSVRAAKNGKGNSDVRDAVAATSEKIRDLALDKLMSSLGIINGETLGNCTAKDASVVARNLAGVVGQLSPREKLDGNQVTFVIYAPKQKTEEHFQTVEVQAI